MTRDPERMSDADRFWSKVRPEPGDGCWLWTGSVGGHGYGQIYMPGKPHRTVRAHRWSWEYHFGPIPKGTSVCHKCDVPACVNPSHLWLGTQADNMQDRDRKRRQAVGVANARTRLTETAVRSIRARLADGSATRNAIANEYGVAPTTVANIRDRVTWKHL